VNSSDGPAATRRILNLAILGYGKMGRTIAQLAPARGCEVRLVMDIDVNPGGAGITREKFDGIDVCLDFTMPEAAVENIRRVAGVGCNLVVGTTGWYAKLDEVRKIVESSGVGMVYAANFSIGVQLFYRVARAAAEIFADFPIYDPYLAEAHHKFKKDAPSGTALELEKIVRPHFKDREIPVAALRAGHIPGTHELGFDSEADTILLRHTARGRQGFAEGALYAARWIAGKKGLFNFAEILKAEPPSREDTK
jgi:4-hydroxy-tetrahydrodipicolinate reductase